MDFPDHSVETVLDSLVLANKYGLQKLEETLDEYIIYSLLSIENVSKIYNFAIQFEREKLKESCIELINKYPKEFLEAENYTILSSKDLAQIISCDSFYVAEKYIFLAVKAWLDCNACESEEDKYNLSQKVRLNLMQLQDLLDLVRPTDIYTDSQLMDAIDQQRLESKKDHRHVTLINTNIATIENGSTLISGSPKYNRLEYNLFNYEEIGPLRVRNRRPGSTTYYDDYYGYTYHASDCSSGITINLKERYMMNCIQFYIIQNSSFYVEISTDNIVWERVVDESQNKHFGQQTWNFDNKIGKYVRVVGTRLWDRIYSSERMPGDFQLQVLKVFYNDSRKPNHAMIKVPS